MDYQNSDRQQSADSSPAPKHLSKKFWVLAALVVLMFAAVIIFQVGNFGAALLSNASRSEIWLVPLIVVASLVDSINPCAISVLLLTIGFLFSLGKSRSGILKVGGSYVFGVFAVYILIGLGILQVLSVLGVPHFMAKVGAGLLILVGLLGLIDEFFPNFPIRLRLPGISREPIARLMKKTSLPAAFVLGGVVGLFEFPCTGGPYLFVLGLLHDSATYLKGLGYLILYNLIFVSPLVMILLIAGEQSLLERMQDWKKTKNTQVRLYGSLALVALGLIIFMF